jgi:HSP20 family protein
MSMMKRGRSMPWTSEAIWPDDRIDRVFRDMFRDVLAGGMMERFAGNVANPLHLEEFIEDGICVIRAELPGIDPDKDVDVTVEDGMLTIKAHREERKEEKRPDAYRSEFRYGSFRRSVRLPEGVTEADVKASYRDGILEVRVPVPTSETTPTRVAVDHS